MKALFVIAQEGYQPREYGVPKQILEKAGIVHNDLEGNIFRYKKNNKDTFYIIDFESVKFLNKNNLGLELNANIIKKYKSDTNNNTRPGPGLFGF